MLAIIKEIKDVIKWRELLWQMTSREIKARYKQSILGYFWVILNPLAQMLVMSFAFSIILRIPTNSASHIPYALFLYTALLPWNLFSTSVSSSAMSLVNSAPLIRKIYFPRSILVISTIIAKLIDFAFALTVLIAFFIFFQIPITFSILWVIPILLIQLVFTLGLSLFFAAANLIYRDIQYLLALVISLWFYITPIVYPADIVPDKFKFIFQLNPMSVFVNAYRQTVLGGKSPDLFSLYIALIVSFITLFLGLLYFKQREKTFADIV